jgi:hypothetical protein
MLLLVFEFEFQNMIKRMIKIKKKKQLSGDTNEKE